jgi:LysR family hydrogen peroxide-inducible transcriptional activator
LFERSTNDVRATPIGAQVIAQAERVLAEAARVTEIAAAGKDPLSGPLKLGVIYTIGPWLLAPLVPLIKERAPQMPLIIAEDYTENLIEKLKASELDVAILALPIQEPGLVAQPVYEEVFRLLVPAGHALEKSKTIHPGQLLDETLLLLGAGNCFRDQVLDLCSLANKQQSPHVLEGSSLETIRYMVASGLGITVMPAASVANISKSDRLLKVRPFSDPAPSRRVGMAWRASFPRHKAIDILRRAIIASRLTGTKVIR